MSGTVNKVILIGHIGDQVKMHYFEGGGSIGRFPLATDETYTNRTTGEKVSNTEWHNIVVRNKAAEICEKYLNKGDKLYVEGRLKSRKWQDDNGNERSSTEIQCTDFTFLTPKTVQNTGTVNSAQVDSLGASYNSKPVLKPQESIGGNDDLPF
jgi:single-strand DNA-binding protein